REAVGQIAFVAAPTLFMALILTSWPRQSIGLRWPAAWSWPAAVLLGLALAPPLAELTLLVFDQFPTIKALLEENRPLAAKLLGLDGHELCRGARWWWFLVLAVLPALCEEVAFRGYILTGLARRFPPTTALFISAFFYALYPMNLFEVLPRLPLGLALGFLVMRTNSLWPALVAHLAFNGLRYGILLFPSLDQVLPAALQATRGRSDHAQTFARRGRV